MAKGRSTTTSRRSRSSKPKVRKLSWPYIHEKGPVDFGFRMMKLDLWVQAVRPFFNPKTDRAYPSGARPGLIEIIIDRGADFPKSEPTFIKLPPHLDTVYVVELFSFTGHLIGPRGMVGVFRETEKIFENCRTELWYMIDPHAVAEAIEEEWMTREDAYERGYISGFKSVVETDWGDEPEKEGGEANA